MMSSSIKKKRSFPMSRGKSGLFICQGEKGLEFFFANLIRKFSFPIWEYEFLLKLAVFSIKIDIDWIKSLLLNYNFQYDFIIKKLKTNHQNFVTSFY